MRCVAFHLFLRFHSTLNIAGTERIFATSPEQSLVDGLHLCKDEQCHLSYSWIPRHLHSSVNSAESLQDYWHDHLLVAPNEYGEMFVAKVLERPLRCSRIIGLNARCQARRKGENSFGE